MAKVERKTTYFAKPGPANTKDVIDAVADRVKEGGIKTVVVASTSGSTGVKFASAFKGKVKVLAVSHEKMDPKLKDRIVKLGGTRSTDAPSTAQEEHGQDKKHPLHFGPGLQGCSGGSPDSR